MPGGPAARGVIARLAAKRIASVREPEVSAESTAMIEDAASALAVLEAESHTHAAPSSKASRTERDGDAAATASKPSRPTAAEITTDLTAQLKRLLTWQLREEPKITNDVPWIRLGEEVFAVLVCSLALVRGTASSAPDGELPGSVVAEVAQAVADASETAVPEAVVATWHRWVRHMCAVAEGRASAREPGLEAVKHASSTATERNSDGNGHDAERKNNQDEPTETAEVPAGEAAAEWHPLQVREHWPAALQEIVRNLDPDTELAKDVAKRSTRCFQCGNWHALHLQWPCTFPPHEFYAALGGEAFLIAYLAEKGLITPTTPAALRAKPHVPTLAAAIPSNTPGPSLGSSGVPRFQRRVRSDWPEALQAIIRNLDTNGEDLLAAAQRTHRCFKCGNARHGYLAAGCPYPPHEFYEPLGREAFLIAYLADKGIIKPTSLPNQQQAPPTGNEPPKLTGSNFESPRRFRRVRSDWPMELQAIMRNLDTNGEDLLDAAKRTNRCFICGNLQTMHRVRPCTNKPHEFYQALGREAFLIAYLADRGLITPTAPAPREVSV